MAPPGGLESHVDLGTQGEGGRHRRRATERGVHIGVEAHGRRAPYVLPQQTDGFWSRQYGIAFSVGAYS